MHVHVQSQTNGKSVLRVARQQNTDNNRTSSTTEKMSSQIRLRLLPRARCLFDEPVQVKVDGLRSSQMVTVRARATDERGVAFSSSATYRADGGGVVDLERDPSLGGSYTGIEPTGLLWSMKPATPHKRFQRTNAMNPHVVKFSVEEQEEGGGVLAEAANERLLIRDGVSRKTVKDGNIRGVLFTPPGEGPFPAVLDLYTFGGGLSERRASLLASRGFLVLTVALYGHEDMPKAIQVVHLDYFEEAIRLLKKQDGVGSNDVGVISMSKSADLALSIASFLSGVAATVWINGCCSNVMLPLHFRGKQLLPGLRLDVDKLIPPKDESGAADSRKVLRDPLAEENRAALVPVERAECRFLFVASGDDHNWDSAAYMEAAAARLRRHGKENFECVCYPGAGHYLEPPYGPYCPSSFHGVVSQPVMWGGEPRAHAHAEIHLWKKIQEFFRAHLSVGTKDVKAKM